ncbi:MAG TPA: hypothetical protein PKE07_00510 [Lacibacter sp.]|nr:hypothetical protein [Lacibacter sp.]HMO88221.1 hypothetical protein [Lacibacter sp.]
MLKIFIALLLLLHGLIHVLGFAKSFGLAELRELTQRVSRPVGLLWLLVALLFIIAAFLWWHQHDNWIWVALPAIVLSQVLIFMVWKDARFGTIANMLLLVVALAELPVLRFQQSFRNDVRANLQANNPLPTDLVTEADLAPLPPPVQRYLRLVGVVNKPRVKSMRIEMEGELRQKDQDWFPVRFLQYSFFEAPTRLFFLKARMNGLPVPGYHHFENGKATMEIRLLGLKQVAFKDGPEMDQSETVTFFNDMCLLAPATLIDPRITWEAIDSASARGTFTYKDIRVTAVLYFNEQGELIDFISYDRYVMDDLKRFTFSTPLQDYQDFNGYRLAGAGEAIWHYPDGLFSYGRFRIKEVQYNVSE